jgi:CsoR family transcriptional regulator, copper-sensing transcriptional repressor
MASTAQENPAAVPGVAVPGAAVPGAAVPGYVEHRSDHLRRLAKIEGQVRGIARMVEHDRYCIDVLTQVSAATRALHEVALSLLDEHLRHCVLDAVVASPAEGQAKLDELTTTLRQALRL